MVLVLFGSSCSFPFSVFLPSVLVGVAKVSGKGAITCAFAGPAIAIVLSPVQERALGCIGYSV